MSESEVVESSRKLFTVLEQVVEKGNAGVTEIAKETSLAKSTTHLHLQSLLEAGYIIKRGNRYHPSLQLFELGETARNGTELYIAGREEVDKLSSEVHGVAKIGVLEGDLIRLAYVAEADSQDAESSAQSISTEFNADTPSNSDGEYRNLLGKEMQIHATAIGKAVLAEMPDDRVASIIGAHNLPRCTQNTITDRNELYDELAQIRDQGYAIDSGEWIEGLWCVGAAITRDGTPVGAVSITGPDGRMDRDLSDEVARKVINTANIVEVKITHN